MRKLTIIAFLFLSNCCFGCICYSNHLGGEIKTKIKIDNCEMIYQNNNLDDMNNTNDYANIKFGCK